jgi:hypothetical protein
MSGSSVQTAKGLGQKVSHGLTINGRPGVKLAAVTTRNDQPNSCNLTQSSTLAARHIFDRLFVFGKTAEWGPAYSPMYPNRVLESR